MTDDLPDWVVGDIQNAKFKSTTSLDGTGYILEIYEKDSKADIELFAPVEDGRHIVTVDIGDDIKMNTLEKGTVYHFIFEQHKAPLSRKTVKYLQSEQNVDMKAIYRFVLNSLEIVNTDVD